MASRVRRSKFQPIGASGSRNTRIRRSFQSVAREKVAFQDVTIRALQQKKILELKQLEQKKFEVFAKQEAESKRTAPGRAASLAKRSATKTSKAKRGAALQKRKAAFEKKKRKTVAVQKRKTGRATGKTIDRTKLRKKILAKQGADAVARIKAGIQKRKKQSAPGRKAAAAKRAKASRGKTARRRTLGSYRAKRNANAYSPIPSAVVAEHGYDRTEKILYVEFTNGAEYVYFDIPWDIFLEFIGGDEYCLTDGSNAYGSWFIGKRPSLGAYLYWNIFQAGYEYSPL